MDVAAGVPFTALPPAVPVSGPVPLVVTWHMLDAPCTDVSFAAALPLREVPAWRVHLGMPMCGRRMRAAGMQAIVDLAREDAVRSYVEPFVRQASEEFPAVLAELRARFPVDDGPVGLVGGSLGGGVVLEVLRRGRVPVSAAALVNPAIRARSLVAVLEGIFGWSYPWTEEAGVVADRLDYVAAADAVAVGRPAVLVVSGEEDHAPFRVDAVALVGALRERTVAELVTVPGLAHALAEYPGVEPAPQSASAQVVDDTITRWLLSCLRG